MSGGFLVFIEHKHEVSLLEKFIDQDTVVISLRPSVSSELAQRNIPYQNTLSFFGKETQTINVDLYKD